MNKTVFHIAKMDCPSEEQMIRMKLQGLESVRGLDFDIPNRRLSVLHDGDYEAIFSRLDTLDFNTKVESSEASQEPFTDNSQNQQKLLWTVLIINFTFFVLEVLFGLVSRSMGLVADGLDMLADSLVYFLALLAVGKSVVRKKKVAKLSGYLQLALAVIGFVEVLRRFFGFEAIPEFRTMIIVSIGALIANAACLYILQKSRDKEAHMKASMIFTSNDIVINLGVVAAGVLVYFTQSNYPDLIIGAIVFIIVIRGAFSILKLSK